MNARLGASGLASLALSDLFFDSLATAKCGSITAAMPVKSASEGAFSSTFTGDGGAVELDGKVLLFKSVDLTATTASTAEPTTPMPTSATMTVTETSTSVVSSSTTESTTTTAQITTTTPDITTAAASTTVTEDPSLNAAAGGVGMSDNDRLTVIICVVAGVVIIICVIVVVVVCQKKGTDKEDGSAKAQRVANVSGNESSSKEASYGHRGPRSSRQARQHRQKPARDAPPADTDTIDLDILGQEHDESVVGLSDVEMNAI